MSPKTERNEQIVQARQQGQTYERIADRFDISVERVRQIVDRADRREKYGVRTR